MLKVGPHQALIWRRNRTPGASQPASGIVALPPLRCPARPQQTGAPEAVIALEEIDGALDQAAAEARSNTAGRELVCYGSLHVQGAPKDIAAWRG